MLRFLTISAFLSLPLLAQAQTLPTTAPELQQQPRFTDTGVVAPPSLPVAPLPEVKKALTQPDAVLLDVRTPAEYAAGHLPGAQNLDYRSPEFAKQLALLDPQKTYVLYCASGNRSGKAAVLMQEKGFQKVVNAGGYPALKESGVKK
ncbi:rhodanese-like domain-containing protein [Hymenobacter weizhouensis]|uniref:rhodanese-like domain-containing protein n=1 Tax=Hymenobacter sp. YIM 151500-1 TaxID=2987689 RepID=UPI002225F8D9|nr:rhodanese-like domain-containing protein [Hymenobacter sp. YIM 151500-1]UYZ64230.1 rhodanese-like domain-containing protein [Hymenobacter sp. YIM 151500-1]